MGLSSVRARFSASSPHGCQSTGFAACCSRYGLVSCARRLGMMAEMSERRAIQQARKQPDPVAIRLAMRPRLQVLHAIHRMYDEFAHRFVAPHLYRDLAPSFAARPQRAV